MRIVFCGSGPFAVPSLHAIIAAGHELLSVITQPPRPAGRGGKVRATPAGQAAREAGIAVIECPNINADEVVSGMRAAEPDVMCVADFGQLIRQPARDSARLGAFNLHGSLLPALRGAAPVNWAIIRGLPRTGVTTFELADKMDAGPIYLQAQTDIRPDETAEQLRDRLAEIGAKLLCDTLDLLASGDARPRGQDESAATTAPRLKKSDGIVNWADNAVAIRNRIHGTWPWPGAQSRLKRPAGRDVDVVIAAAAAAVGVAAGEPGTVDEELCVATGSGRLKIVQIRPAGKRLMGWRDFVNGYRVSRPDRFVAIEP